MTRWLGVVLCAFLSFQAVAATHDEIRKQVEASMLVSGTIEINPDGSVRTYAIDQAAKLSPSINDCIRQTVTAWRFQVDTKKEVIAKARMTLRLLAKSVDDKHIAVSVGGETIGKDDGLPTDDLQFDHRAVPAYPKVALDARATGVVYLLLRVNRDGKVDDAWVEQVNLTTYSSDLNVELMRKTFAKATLGSAKRWTFHVPTTGALASAPYWVARLPISFEINGFPYDLEDGQFGKWSVYLRGPRHPVLWDGDPKLLSSAPDAVPEGGVQTLGVGPQLLEGDNGA